MTNEPDYEAMWKVFKTFLKGYIVFGKIDRHCGEEIMHLIEDLESGDLKKPKIPDHYINPHAKDIQVRDQGERNTSVAISSAYAIELMNLHDTRGEKQ